MVMILDNQSKPGFCMAGNDVDEKLVGFKCATESVFAMCRQGVVHAHIPPTVLIMTGLALVETFATPTQIADWLEDVAHRYRRDR